MDLIYSLTTKDIKTWPKLGEWVTILSRLMSFGPRACDAAARTRLKLTGDLANRSAHTYVCTAALGHSDFHLTQVVVLASSVEGQ